MSKTGTFVPSGLRALVVDRVTGQRLLSLEQLRLMGFGAVSGAANAQSAWDLVIQERPDIILVEWLEPASETLDFIRRVRQAEDSPNRAVALFVLTSRGSLGEVEQAREAGVDGYLRKPISIAAIQERLKAVVANPQPFIVTATYVGPDRRRRQDPDYAGPWRRASDQVEPETVQPQADPNAERARVAVAALEKRARGFTADDAQGVAELGRLAADLATVGEQIGDPNLVFGTRELARYLGNGAIAPDPEAVRTHIAALYQFVLLPQSSLAVRESVAQSLKRMVDKKLRIAG